MLHQKTPQVYGGAMSILKNNRQDTQHFRDQSIHLMFLFFGFHCQILPMPSHSLPPEEAVLVSWVALTKTQNAAVKQGSLPCKPAPAAATHCKATRHALSPKAMLCQMSAGRFAAHNRTIPQVVFTREGRRE